MGRLCKVQGESQAGTTGSWELGVEQQERIRLSRQTDKCDQQEEKRLQSLRLKGQLESGSGGSEHHEH